MKNQIIGMLIWILAISSSIMPPAAVGQTGFDRSQPKMPDPKTARGRVSRGGDDPLDKLAPELRMLYRQFAPTRGAARGADETGLGGFTAEQLLNTFGIKMGDMDPVVTLSVGFAVNADPEALREAGISAFAHAGKTVYAKAAVQQLARIAGIKSVSSIGIFTAGHIPSPTQTKEPQINPIGRGGDGPSDANKTTANRFNKQGLTGKGVIVGVIDTGIDWRHEDFIRPDGTSRILAIWDFYDDSYLNSNGKIGSKPPVISDDNQSSSFGTVYTNEQINAALKGSGTVNTTDRYGHGTAVAGTAASNGRATGKGVPAGTYDGVAPEADLIVVRASDCGGFAPEAELASGWITDMAKSLNRPVVVNMSFGGQYSSHDGTKEGEQYIDRLTGPGKPGKIITVSAGNDGQFNLHASGKFGPKRAGQEDNFSDWIELEVKAPSLLLGLFDPKDDWGISFQDLTNNPAFQGADGKPTTIYIYKDKGQLTFNTASAMKNPKAFQEFLDQIESDIGRQRSSTDVLHIGFPVGYYAIKGFGGSASVRNGKFDLYSPNVGNSFFGMGTDKTQIVGSPGNAKNAITVGSYDFRASWENLQGATASYNLTLGGSSSYTSPGYRRDGVIKPDITAPAQFTISSLSQFARPNAGGCEESMATGKVSSFTKDGYHVAWAGTSAAAPYTAGVIALMLQKNPNLDAEQVRQIFRETARKDGKVGGVPNAVWGWGMINPAAAISMTKLPGSRPVKKPRK